MSINLRKEIIDCIEEYDPDTLLDSVEIIENVIAIEDGFGIEIPDGELAGLVGVSMEVFCDKMEIIILQNKELNYD